MQSSTPKTENILLRVVIALGVALVGIGLFLLLMTFRSQNPAPVTQTAAPGSIVQFTFGQQGELPYLITDSGQVLVPDDAGSWQIATTEDNSPVHSIYIDADNIIWAATDAGLQAHHDNQWQLVDDRPIVDVLPLATGTITLDEDGRPVSTLTGEAVALPGVDGPMEQVVTLDDNTNIVRADGEVYLSISIDEWIPLEPPAPVSQIWMDADGHLLAGTDRGVFRWFREDRTWQTHTPSFDAAPFEDLAVFNGITFATVNGRLVRYTGTAWETVPLGEEVYLSQLELRGDDSLWVLDAGGMRLWSTTDGEAWAQTAIRVAGAEGAPTPQ